MEQAKILLFGFDSTDVLADALRKILEFYFPPSVEIRYEQVESDDDRPWDGGICKAISSFSPDMVFLTFPLGRMKQARALIRALRRASLETPVIIVTEAVEPGEMFALLKLGATDFLTPPLKPVDTIPRVWRLLEQSRREQTFTYTLKEKLGLKQLVGESQAFMAEIRKIPLIARSDANILIYGETGTGKELCARAIHYLSPRVARPFTPVNCGAIPSELVENELFGHERGAFTGASSSQTGLIHEADGGTLFLDEIDCLPLPAQVKLLRFLQEKEYRPLGSAKVRKADVRVMAATNINLEEAVREGRLRQDLYFRLNIIPLTLPPLRERKEDIPLLTRHFLLRHAAELNKQEMEFSPEAMQKLLLYEWPGNVRELEHIIERAVVLSEQRVIQNEDIFLPQAQGGAHQGSFQEAKAKMIEQFERSYIERLLLAYKGNISRAARAAKKNRRAFWQLVRKHRIEVASFKPDPS